ncbi:MAG: cpaB [Alphaproteobacteria bacterium]|nr:cpaB [Alphaproteobacteria bacterium]MDB5722587.1 cpaB [Alphaproteobacteria bacterium]
MDVKKIVLLIGALVVAAVTAVLAKNMFTGASAPQASATPVAQQQLGPEVLVATRALPVGTIIDAESFRFQPWPQGLVQPAYFIKDQTPTKPQELIGRVVRSDITAGQPISAGSLIKPGERGFLAAALGPGMRAITVGVSATSSVAGFVFPGDRVDMVLTQSVDGQGGPPLKVSETIIRNIRVLATDQRMSAQGEDGKPVVQNFSSVTLEATPKIAEKIAVAQTIGTLSLSLRSLSDNNAELERAIASGEVKVPENADPKAEKRLLIEIASKPIDTRSTFTVGADVSRFQRSTIPHAPPPPQQANSNPSPSAAPGAIIVSRPLGPVVRVARGNNITIVPVGGK